MQYMGTYSGVGACPGHYGSTKGVKNVNEYFITHHSLDISISFQSTHEVTQEVLVILIAILCITLPPLLLILYPIKRFRNSNQKVI